MISMLAKEVLGERYVTTAEVKEILLKRSKVDELRYEQRTALDYATRFSRTTGKEARRIVDELLKKVEGLKEHQAVLIVNLLPVDKDDLKLIFAKERIRLDEGKIDAILRIANSAKLIDKAKIESELEKARLAEEALAAKEEEEIRKAQEKAVEEARAKEEEARVQEAAPEALKERTEKSK